MNADQYAAAKITACAAANSQARGVTQRRAAR